MQTHGDLMNGHIEARWREREGVYRDRDMNGLGKCVTVENGS